MVHNRPKWYLFMLVPKAVLVPTPFLWCQPQVPTPRCQPHGANNKGGAVVVVGVGVGVGVVVGVGTVPSGRGSLYVRVRVVVRVGIPGVGTIK